MSTGSASMKRVVGGTVGDLADGPMAAIDK